jgi:hypothetical protein
VVSTKPMRGAAASSGSMSSLTKLIIEVPVPFGGVPAVRKDR